MKKTKISAVVLATAIMLMGASYAWWTDSTTVHGTVDTGIMDVKIQWANTTAPDYSVAEVPVISPDKNTVTFKVSDIYPTVYKSFGEGSGQTFSRIHFQVVNDGTVPVKLAGVELNRTKPNSEIWDYLRTEVHITTGTNNGTSSFPDSSGLQGSPNALTGDLKDLDTILMADARNPQYKVLNDFVLNPGQAIRFGGDTDDENSIRFYLDPTTPNSVQDKEVEFNLKLNWVQFNQPL